jgi:hypothetical protein
MQRPVESRQFQSWAFTERASTSGVLSSMGAPSTTAWTTLGRAIWARVQVELLNRRRWRTRLKLSTSLFKYVEIFHNRLRRHSALGMVSPVEYELRTPQPVSETKQLDSTQLGTVRNLRNPGQLTEQVRRRGIVRPSFPTPVVGWGCITSISGRRVTGLPALALGVP